MGISNVRIGGKRAKKDKRGRWSTKKKREKEKIEEAKRQTLQNVRIGGQPTVAVRDPVTQTIVHTREPAGREVAPVIKLEPVKKETTKEKLERLRASVIKLEPKKKKSILKKTLGFNLSNYSKGEEVKTGSLPLGVGIGAGAKDFVKGAKMILGGAKTTSKAAKLTKLSRPLRKIGQRINVNQIGKSAGLTKAQTSALAKQIGRERINVLARHAVNPKSTKLSTKILITAGVSMGVASIAKDIIGTYPFAGFVGGEETTQQLGIPIYKAIDAGDIEGTEILLDAYDEIINAAPTLADKIPYANVQKGLNDFHEAADLAMNEWRRLIEIRKQELLDAESEEDKWARIYEEQDARREEQRASDEEYWEGVKESQAKAREEGREEDAQYWNDVRERNEEAKKLAEQEDLEEMQWKAEYYDLLRQGKPEEAAALLQSKLKGGEENE